MSFTDSNDLIEVAMAMIQAEIKAKIATALQSIRTDRADAKVSTEVPRSYFNYESATTYRCPAVFIIPKDTQFKLDQGANHINAVINAHVAVVVEDKNLPLLVSKSWRYQSALYKILNQASLTSADNKVKIVLNVQRATLSPEFTTAQKQGDVDGMFQKEVALEIEVRHFESN
jgi:hypothetical protein